MKTQSTAWLRAALMAGLVAMPASAQAQPAAYPSRPIRMISPFAPGGGNDILARLVAQPLSEALGRNVFVENKPGANTVIGTELVVRSTPDGYTLLVAGISHVINPSLLGNLPYDAIGQFTPVGMVATAEQIMVVHPALPANSLQEFIALAKSRPAQLNYSSAGSGTSVNLAGEMFNLLAGTRIQHIPYKGTAPALADVVAGQVEMSLGAPNASLPFIRNGRLKALAVTGRQRLPALPQVPTFAEAGLATFDAGLWYGILGPAGIPGEIVGRLSTELRKIVASPEFKDRLQGLGMAPYFATASQFGTQMKIDHDRYARLIKDANIKAD